MLDWHSDARVIMDSYANDIAYRQIAGTQIELLRLGERAEGIAAAEVAVLFERHVQRCGETGHLDLAFTRESFVGFLVSRVLLRASDNRYVTTTVGHGMLQYIDERELPDKAL